ncbi:hypothetical protein [Novosphingobium colocasiae]|uniref:hypothetical protein n=1 Tax=Novosphingobium colocasiae TaxID=1256513 RepID=UPI0035B07D20
MAEETVTTSPNPSHTTIIREGGSGSGMGIVIAIILLVAVIGGFYLFSQNSSSEAAKDNAVAQAADSVSSAANKVGNAAEDAASKADPAN